MHIIFAGAIPVLTVKQSIILDNHGRLPRRQTQCYARL